MIPGEPYCKFWDRKQTMGQMFSRSRALSLCCENTRSLGTLTALYSES